jgi:cysteine desulfurase
MESQRLRTLQQISYNYIKKELPGVTINGSTDYRLPNNLHLTFPGMDNEQLMMALDEQGFMVAVGSACSASNDEPSHVLKAIGLSDQDAQSSLRITMGRQTTEKDLLDLLQACKQLTTPK